MPEPQEHEYLNIPGPLPRYLETFRHQIVVEGLSRKTAFEYTLNVSLFLRWVRDSGEGSAAAAAGAEAGTEVNTDVSGVTITMLSCLTDEDANEYMFYLTEQGSGVSARCQKLTALNRFFEWLKNRKQLPENPFAAVPFPKKPKTLPKYLSADECVQVLGSIATRTDANAVRDYLIFTIFLNTGMRIHELTSLNEGDISAAKRAVTVIGKGNVEREIPVNDMVLEALEAYAPVRSRLVEKFPEQEGHALLISRVGGRLTDRQIQSMVKKRILEAGLDARKFTPHKLRHTAATLMYTTTKDIRSVQEILGHASLGTTQIYTRVSNEQTASVVERNPLNRQEPAGPSRKASED